MPSIKYRNYCYSRAVPGVIQINIDDEQHAIHIYADNAQAAKEARHVSIF